MPISRLYNFLGGQPIHADQVDEEFNQIVNLLSGVSTDVSAYIQYSSASEPPLKLNQLSTGDIFKAKAAGVDALRVTYQGQIRSTVSSPTPPIICTSQTKVTNLNADQVNGIEGSALIRNDQVGQAVLSDFRIKKASTGTYDVRFYVNGDTLYIYRYNPTTETNEEIFEIENLNSTNKLISLDSTIRLQSAFTPSADNDIARLSDLTARNTILSVNQLVAATNSFMCPFVAPAQCYVVGVKAGYLSGTPSTALTLAPTKNGASMGTSLILQTSSTTGTVYSQSLTPVLVEEGDLCYLVGSNGSGFANIFAAFVGYYTGE